MFCFIHSYVEQNSSHGQYNAQRGTESVLDDILLLYISQKSDGIANWLKMLISRLNMYISNNDFHSRLFKP